MFTLLIKTLMTIALITALSIYIFVNDGLSLYAGPVNSGDNLDHSMIAKTNQPLFIKKEKPIIDVVFVLDTTSSMSGMIDAAKERIWSIATTLAQATPTPTIRVGLVAFRDRGDEYVTQRVPLTHDLDSLFLKLMALKAEGGGDGPESVNQALHEGVTKMNWAENATFKTLFLVGDAPAHMDYQDDVPYSVTSQLARKKNIVINTLLCGAQNIARQQWEQLAQLSQGRFLQVEQSGGRVAVVTPFDEQIAQLSKDKDNTRLYYGSKEKQELANIRLEENQKLYVTGSRVSQTRRALYNATESGKENFAGENELLTDLSLGKVTLDELNVELLPERLKKLSKKELALDVSQSIEERKAIDRKLESLASQRKSFIEKNMDKSKQERSFDNQLFEAIKEQTKKSDIVFENEEAEL